jgi:predicted enzyme related to lactoylglutathione lyase
MRAGTADADRKGATMLAYIANPLVQVSDPDRALEFYTGRLGFEKRADALGDDGARWIEVAPPGARRAIVLTRDHRPGRERRAGRFAGIVFGTRDIEATYRELRARGVTFTEPPTPQPAGMLQAQFVDDDGNGFVLVQP